MIRLLRWTAVLLLISSSAFGIDLEISSRLDNLYWSADHGDNAKGYTYQATDLFWNVQGSVTQALGDNLNFKGGLEIDPILRWRAYSQLAFSLDNLGLKFTPFLGVFNSTAKWFNPGMEAQVEYTWPGLLFLRGGFLTTFAPVAKAGDYYLSSQNVTLGTLMENGILSFTIEDKSATFRVLDGFTTVDASTKYGMDTEMFLKNFPLRWAILTGYQITSRSYIVPAETKTTLHSALLGARLSYDFGSGTVVYLQGEASIFNAGWDKTILAVPSSSTVFQSVAGVRYHW